MKPVDFHPKALDFIRAQPVSIRHQIGVHKKSQKTPVREISTARQRLQEVLDEAVES